jgi:hypothetical protein
VPPHRNKDKHLERPLQSPTGVFGPIEEFHVNYCSLAVC